VVRLDDNDNNDVKVTATTATTSDSDNQNILSPMYELTQLRSIHTPLYTAFTQLGFTVPTPVQAQTWPLLFAGRDVVGIAKTGSGKTLAFAVPLVAHVTSQPDAVQRSEGPLALVMAPTRELAQQIEVECQKLFDVVNTCYTSWKNYPLRALCVYGGVPKHAHLTAMQTSPTLVVATPGRLIDLLNTGQVGLTRVVYVVLDECDRMLDMGMLPQVRTIFTFIRSDRQTMMFSATWPKEVQQLASSFTQKNAIRVQVGSEDLHANADVRQHFVFLKSHGDKFDQLRILLKKFIMSKRTLVFVKKRVDADALEQQLHSMAGIRATSFHGDKDQQERMDILARFRTHGGVLVATDVASRGLDIQELDVVINYDFPMTLEDYVHRIGRTARAGATGDAFSFVTRREKQLNPWVVAELITLLENANQRVPQELRTWAADTMGQPKPPPRPGPHHIPIYRGGNRPSAAVAKAAKQQSSLFGQKPKKKRVAGLFGDSMQESFNPFA